MHFPDRAVSRREFHRLLAALGALGALDPQATLAAMASDRRRLSWLAFRTMEAEGEWTISDVEGTIPPEIDGTLYRVGPGQRENHGVELLHFFDGDAFVKAWEFREGRLRLQARFVATPERVEEIEAGRMIYSEFGTLAPPPPPGARRKGLKNQPSVNIVPWGGRLLGLSEGGHPSAIDPATLDFQGYWDFGGTLPRNVPFTAHPKFDPATGEGFAFGVKQSMTGELMVYRMDPASGALAQLHAIPLGGFFMIHDMLMTKTKLVFVVPPATIDVMAMMSGKVSLGESLRYLAEKPLRLLIVSRDGTGEPVWIERDPGLVFHHGNAFEDEAGRIVLDTMLAPEGAVLKSIQAWRDDKLPPAPDAILTRLTIDPASGAILDARERDVDQEFPRFDSRRAGEPTRFLYTMESGRSDDAFAFTHLVRHDSANDSALRVGCAKGRAMGEPVFVPKGADEADGWILVEVYDAERDATALEVRDAATLELQARAWAPSRTPLGFHANFVAGARPA